MKKLFVLAIALLLFPVNAHATGNIVDATGNIFLAPLRYQELNTKYEDWENPPCGASLITPQIAVTAAHCVLYVGQGTGFKSGEVWIQEPGKNKSNQSANRAKVTKIIYPKDLSANQWKVPYHDIAFLILSKPLVDKVQFEVATLEEVRSLIDNSSTLYGYGHFFGDLSALESWRTSSNKFPHADPRRGTVTAVKNGPHNKDIWIGFPYTIYYKVPPCRGNHGSGTPITAIIDGKEKLVGIEGSSSGWSCDNNPYSNIVRAMVVANYLELIKDIVDNTKTNSVESEIKKETTNIKTNKEKIVFVCQNKKGNRITSYRYSANNIKCPRGYSLIK